MPQNYSGRITLIIGCVLFALFGIPYLNHGIFAVRPLTKDKPLISLNLKPGIDIAGGTSLVYEIKAPPGGFDSSNQSLAEQVATLLKKRVDPTGTRNLIWRPQGDSRLEIQLPRSSMSAEGSGQIKSDYAKVSRELENYNLTYGQVISAVESLTGEARTKRLAELARGNTTRTQLFEKLVKNFDALKVAEAELAAMQKAPTPDAAKLTAATGKKVLAKIDYDDLKAKIDQTNVLPEDIQALVESPNEAKTKTLNETKAMYPERAALIDQLVAVYPKYLASRGGIDDAADLKKLLKGSGVLEFHIMAVPPTGGRDSTISQEEYETMRQRLITDGPAPQANDVTRWYEVDKEYNGLASVNPKNGKRYALAWTTPERSMIHKDAGNSTDWVLKRAYTTQGQTGALIVGFEFDDVGAELFGQLTGNNIGKQLGTILDNRVITAPSIRSQITKSGTIDGGENGYTEFERNYLINTLNAGSLPATLAEEPISERSVGPQLGETNLKYGLFSCLVGITLIAFFMILYYHLSGLVAVIALVMNLIFILGILAMMNATFTLPGIAGLVLTVGMAVDANVLVFERLREEQLRGLSLKMAIRNAYDRAFTAILDSNITTAITSGFLVYFGSEEVKGFGLTLLIGIISSMFAALFVTRTIFGLMIDKFGVRKLGSLPLSYPKWNTILHPKIDWMGKIGYFITFSLLVIVLGMFAFIQNAYKGTLLDVEFASGTEVQVTTKIAMTDGEIRDLIAKAGTDLPQPAVVALGDQVEKGKYREFSIVTPNADRNQVSIAVEKTLAGVLDINVSSEFAGAKRPMNSVEEAIKGGWIKPVIMKDNKFQIDGADVPDALQHDQGVAVVLRGIKPPLKPSEIYDRINKAALSAINGDMIKRFTVMRLDGAADEQKPTESAVVMLSNRNLNFSKSESDWREKLAGPLWKAVNDGLGEPARLQKVSNFNPQVAGDTQRAAIFATLGSIVFIMIWIWIRFGEHKYGTATVLAMVHDTVMVVGAVGLTHWLADTFLGRMLLLEAFRVNLTLVAAILTVMGYSMVDTIVVFDRIRENRGKYGMISRKLINDSVNQTLSRTLLTAGTTMVTVLVMYVLGGPAIHGFTFILLVGILFGTYSSIAIAAPILLMGTKPEAGGGKVKTELKDESGKSMQKIGA